MFQCKFRLHFIEYRSQFTVLIKNLKHFREIKFHSLLCSLQLFLQKLLNTHILLDQFKYFLYYRIVFEALIDAVE